MRMRRLSLQAGLAIIQGGVGAKGKGPLLVIGIRPQQRIGGGTLRYKSPMADATLEAKVKYHQNGGH